jgi:hypothetical protein
VTSPGLTPATQAAAAVAELQRRQRAGSSLSGPGPGPIAAPKPPAGLLERPKVEPFARRVAAPALPPAVQAIADRYRPGRSSGFAGGEAEAGPMDAAAAVAAMKRDRAARFLERFGGRMTISTGGQVLEGDGPRLDDLEATIELAERPRWAPLVERDPEGLGAVEWWLRQVGRELGPQFRQGLAVDQVGQLAYREMMGEDLSLEDRATLATGLEGQPAETMPGAAANLLGSSLPTLGEGVRGAVAGAATGAAVGFLATGGPGAPAGAAAGAAAVGMAAGATYSYRTQAGLAWAEFGQFVDESGHGLDPDVRKAAAATAGLLGAGLETVGLGAILRQFPGLRDLGAAGGRELVKRLLARPSFRQALGAAARGWASAVAVETATEVAQELVTITAGELAKVADGEDFQAIGGQELLDRVGSTAWQTARGMALLAIPGPAASFAVDLRRAARAERESRAYLALGDLAGKSTARTEAPGEFQAWVGEVREAVGGPVDSVLVDGEAFKTFFQEQGADPEQVAAELGVVEQYRSFADNGGSIAVPLEVWAAKVAATPAHRGLADHVRLTPDAMTLAEARQYRADLEDMAAEAAEAAPASPAARILDDVARQLEAAGRAPDVARQEAAVFAAFFSTMGERAGVDPWALYQRQALEVRRVLPEGLRGLDDAELDAILGRTRPADGEAATGEDARPLLVQGIEALEAGDLDRLAGIVDAMGEAGEEVPGLFSRAAAPAPLISRAETAAPAPATDRAYLPDGQAVDVAFEVVELAELIASNTADLEPNPAFPAALQPRDRTRAASAEQVARMAGGLVPELLGRSANVSDGAPIVGPDGVVESGNGRVLALGRAYRAGMDSAARYRAWLAGQGYAVDGMAAPVLVRRRLSEMNDTARQRFARAANVRTTASMSAAEQARADGAALTPDLLAMIRSNDIEAAANRPFASRFLGTIAGGSELGQLVDGEGRLSLDGRRRIRGALLARAYGDIALVERLLEEDEGGLGPLGRALLDAAPEWARLDDAETTAALLEAVRAVVRQRDGGNPLHFALQQSDAFGGGLSVDGRAFLASFLNVDPKTGRSRLLSRVRLRKLLEAVVDEAAKHQGGASLLGDDARPSVGQIVAAVDKRARRELVETLTELGLDPATATAADIEAATGAADRSRNSSDGSDSGAPGRDTLEAGAEPDGAAEVGATLFQRDRWDTRTGDLFARARRAVELSPAERATFRKLARREPLTDAETAALIVQGLVEPDGEAFTVEGLRLFEVFDSAVPTAERREPPRPMQLGAPQVGVGEVQRTRAGQSTSDLTRAEAARVQAELAELEAKPRPGKRQQERIRELRRKVATLAEAAAEADRQDAERQAAADRATAGRTFLQKQRGDDRTLDLFAPAGPTDGAAFRRWFGGSKVVDGEGRPLVVYHGTGRDFEAFDVSRAGSAADSGFLGVGAYFSNLPRVADAYATTTRYEGAPAVLPVYLALKNPFRWGPKTGGARDLVYFNEPLPAAIHDEVVRRAGFEFDPDKRVDPTFDERRISEVITEVLRERGHDGVVADIEGEPAEFLAFDPGQVKSVHNRGTFDPDDPRLLYQNGEASGAGDPRGAITFTPDGRTLLRLFQGANLSTILHEAGHLFLEVYGQLDAKPGTPAHIRADYQKILDWLGVIDTADIGREHHEKFARGFEAYLMEGRAPSLELQRPFARFRAWLVLIYRTLRGLDVDLADDVRRVFDRMLATDDAIKAAERAGHFAPLFPADDRAGGMTPAERRAYLEQAERATLEATRQLERDAMEALERERSAAWAAAVARHQEEVAAELDQRPGFRALAFFGGSMLDGQEVPPMLRGLKLSRAVIRHDYGPEALAALEAKRAQHGRILAVDGVHPDDVADVLGFASGAELVAAMAAAPDRAEVIKAEAERRARAELGDAFLSPSTLAEAAAEAVHNDERALFLSSELKMLAGRVDAVPPPLQVIKAAAARAVEAETIRQVTSPDRHLYTSQKWAREAQRHVARGDFRMATEAKRRQLFHFEAWKVARRNAKSIENTLKRWDMISRGRVKNLPAEHRDQILGFLERIDFRKASRAAVERRRTLAEWIKAQEDQGLQVDIDERMRSEAKRPHYSELSVAEFMAYRDTVAHLEHLGRIDGKLLATGREADFAATVDSIVQSITDNAGTLEPVAPDFGPKKGDRRSWRRFLASHRKMEFIFSGLDGHKLGPVWEHLFKPLADAQGAEADLHLRLSDGLRAIFGRYTGAERRAMRKRSIHVPRLGHTFTRASLLSLALNWGNAGNRAAVLEGYGWAKEDVQAALDQHLDARDWQVVQELWRLVDSLWPDIERLQKDLTGSAPPKVEPIKVQTPFGEIDGGYYPLMYDPDLSHKAYVREEQQATAELFGGNFTRPATRKGHTIARKGSGGLPVLLDLAVLPRHLAQVVKDISHRRAVIDVARLTEAPAVRDAITAALGRDTYQLIRPWLQQIAAPAYDPGSGLEAVFARARVGVTVANMGLKLTTAIVQPLGYLTTLAHLGPRWSMVGLAEVFKAGPLSALEARDFAFSRSAEMRHRQKAFDRDVKDTIRRLTGEGGIERWRAAFFWHIGALDMLVALPTWHGAYRQALEADPGNEAAAIAAADSAVRMTQSAGGAKDLARIQAGTELQRLFTAFYSYFSVLFNQFEKSIRQANFANPADYPRFIGQMAALWFVPAVLGELIVGRGPDDDEAWTLWAAKVLAAYPLQSVVFVRDLANGVLGGYGYDLAPAGDVFGAAVRLGIDLAEGDASRSAITNATMAAAFWWGLPGRQMIITGEAFTDWLRGDFDPESFGEVLRYGLLQRRPPDER